MGITCLHTVTVLLLYHVYRTRMCLKYTHKHATTEEKIVKEQLQSEKQTQTAKRSLK